MCVVNQALTQRGGYQRCNYCRGSWRYLELSSLFYCINSLVLPRVSELQVLAGTGVEVSIGKENAIDLEAGCGLGNLLLWNHSRRRENESTQNADNYSSPLLWGDGDAGHSNRHPCGIFGFSWMDQHLSSVVACSRRFGGNRITGAGFERWLVEKAWIFCLLTTESITPILRTWQVTAAVANIHKVIQDFLMPLKGFYFLEVWTKTPQGHGRSRKVASCRLQVSSRQGETKRPSLDPVPFSIFFSTEFGKLYLLCLLRSSWGAAWKGSSSASCWSRCPFAGSELAVSWWH